MKTGYSVTELVEALADVEVPVCAVRPGNRAYKPVRKSENLASKMVRTRDQCTAEEWLNQYTLEHLDTWVSLAFPKAKKQGTGAWRVSSKDLGRDCEEDLSISPIGIRDFGQEWGENVGYTPIKLIQDFFCSVTAYEKLELADFDENCAPTGSLSRDDAATWLCCQLGLNWNELKAEDVERAFGEPPPEHLDASDPIREAEKAERRAKRPTVRFFDELGQTAEAPDFVEGVICDGQLSVVYGESGVGKTFIVSHLAMCVALGWQWHGRDVERGGVIYIAGEGAAGLEHRIAALRQHHGMHTTKDAQFAIIPAAVDFRDKIAVEETISAVKEAADRLGGRVRLIVIDTLSRAMAGGNENSPEDMGALVSAADRIRVATGAHVSFIHHSGKDDTKGARGHSLLRAAVDTEIKIERKEGGLIVARVTKQRDLECQGIFPFKLRTVALGLDRRGKQITSCVVERAELPPPPLSDVEAEALQVLNSMLFEGDGARVSVGAWREGVLKRFEADGVTKAVTRRGQFKRARDGLTRREIIEVIGDRVGLK
jgi:KaiC/GvpD/RAD55 family RecA-like ATPase